MFLFAIYFLVINLPEHLFTVHIYTFRHNNFEKRSHIANSSICRSYSNINKVDTVTSSPLFPFVKAFHRLPYTCLCNVSLRNTVKDRPLEESVISCWWGTLGGEKKANVSSDKFFVSRFIFPARNANNTWPFLAYFCLIKV